MMHHAVRRGRMLRRLAVGPVVIVATVVLGLGTAFAYFSASGSGTGSATTGTLQTVTLIAVTGTPSTPLLPGGAGDVLIELHNPNGFAVTLVSVTATGPATPDAGHPGCTTTGVSFTNQTGLSIPIAASGNTPVDLTGAATMSAASSSGCQGATFSIPVTIEVRK